MKLYLVRHGIAEDARPGQSDADRRLTEAKVAKNSPPAWAPCRSRIRPTLIITSPLKERVETAEIAAEAARLHRRPWCTPTLWSRKPCPRYLGRHPNPSVRRPTAADEPQSTLLPTRWVSAWRTEPAGPLRKGCRAVCEFDHFGPEPRGTSPAYATCEVCARNHR